MKRSGVINPPDQWLKTIFSFERNIYQPEYAIFQGGLITGSRDTAIS
jgi:hypothetical protein